MLACQPNVHYKTYVSRRQTIDSRPPDTPVFSLRGRFFSVPTLVSFAIAVVLLVFLLSRFPIDLDATWKTIRQTNLRLYGVAFLVSYTTFVFRGARWRTLLRNADPSGTELLPSLGGSSRLILMGWFASCITWFRLGDAYRAYAYYEESGASLSRSMGTVVAERVMDVIVVFLLLLAGFLLLYLDPEMRPPKLFLAVGLALVLASALVLLAMQLFRRSVTRFLPQRIQRSYQGLYEGTMRSFRSLPLVTLLGLLGWLAEVGRLYFVVRATGVEVGVALVVFVALANALLSVVPLSPGGLGIVEAGTVGLLMWVLPREEAVSVVLLDRSISYLSIIPLGAVAFVYHQRVVSRRVRGILLSGQRPVKPGETAPS